MKVSVFHLTLLAAVFVMFWIILLIFFVRAVITFLHRDANLPNKVLSLILVHQSDVLRRM